MAKRCERSLGSLVFKAATWVHAADPTTQTPTGWKLALASRHKNLRCGTGCCGMLQHLSLRREGRQTVCGRLLQSV
eukprot:663694-Prymnesium_polylepis.1